MGYFERLFEPGQIGSLRVANRIIMAPMVTHYAEEGAVTDRMVDYYAERARGGTGLLVLEATYPRSVGHPGRVHIWSDAFLPGLQRLTGEVHRCGGKIAIEINPSRGRVDEADPISASDVPDPNTGRVPRALSLGAIQELVSDFGQSVVRAREAGFDAIMIHGGTGYLISEFLSPRTNLREDDYGGTIQGRARLAVEMVRETKNRGGEDFPVILRLGASERIEGGVSLDDVIETCRLVGEAGADAVDVVSGVAETMEWVVPSMYFPPACNVPLAAEIKQRVDVPISVAGRIFDPFVAEEILEQGKADFVVMGRALLADPYFPVKAKEGRVSEIRKCLGCLRCIQSFSAHQLLVCAVNPALGKEKEQDLRPSETKKKVLVLGGGPAGLQAAVTAADKGHEVVLLEKGERLGGQVNLAADLPHKRDLGHITEYLLGQLESRKDRLTVICGREGTRTSITDQRPDVVIAAVGSVPLIPSIPGIEQAMERNQVVTSNDFLTGNVTVKERAVVIGGGMTGCEVAEELADKGVQVTIVEVLPRLAADAFPWIGKRLLGRLDDKGIRAFTGVQEERITEEGLEIVDDSGEKVFLAADTIILAVGSKPNPDLSALLAGIEVPVHKVGDCKDARKILEAVHEGYEAAMTL